MQTIAERRCKDEKLGKARAGEGVQILLCHYNPIIITSIPTPNPNKTTASHPNKTTAGDLAPLHGDYESLFCVATWVEGAIRTVVNRVKEWGGLRMVTMEQWDGFQTALISMLVCPFAMAPMRESVIPYLRHPDFLSDPCDHPQCTSRATCKGCRFELVPNSRKWALRANHHKTDKLVGILKGPFPGGMAALMGFWAYCSMKYTGRMPSVHSLFYSFRNGHQFTEQTL